MEVPEAHWDTQKVLQDLLYMERMADLSGSVSPSPATARFSQWKEFTSCPRGPHERKINSKLSNPPNTSNKNIFRLFQEGRMELQRWSGSLKPRQTFGSRVKTATQSPDANFDVLEDITRTPKQETHTPVGTPKQVCSQPSHTIRSHVTGIEDYTIILFSAFLQEHRH